MMPVSGSEQTEAFAACEQVFDQLGDAEACAEQDQSTHDFHPFANCAKPLQRALNMFGWNAKLHADCRSGKRIHRHVFSWG